MALPARLEKNQPADSDNPSAGAAQIRNLKGFLEDLFGVLDTQTYTAKAMDVALSGQVTIGQQRMLLQDGSATIPAFAFSGATGTGFSYDTSKAAISILRGGSRVGYLDVVEHYSDAKVFGAVGDGVADDTAAIQAAIDDALYISKCGTVYLPAGTYKTTDTLHFGYGVTYESTAYRAGRMIGAGIDPNDGGVAGTTIKPTFSDRPCIAISGGFNVYFSDFTLFGLNDIYPELMYFDMAVEANWIKAGLHANADSRYAPYAGIAMDPYKGTAPATPYPDVTFPAFLGSPAQYGKAVSSMTHFNRLRITQFVVGVVASPSGDTNNNDFIKIDHCIIGGNKYNISICEANNRNLNVSGGQINAAWKCLVNNVHGSQQGYVNGHFNEVCMDWCWQLVDINAGNSGPCKFTGCYAEAWNTIGRWRGNDAVSGALSFESCHFWTAYTNQPDFMEKNGEPLTHLWGATEAATEPYALVRFVGCELGVHRTFNFQHTNVSFDMTEINGHESTWYSQVGPGGISAHASGGIFPNWTRLTTNALSTGLTGTVKSYFASIGVDAFGATDRQVRHLGEHYHWGRNYHGRPTPLCAWSLNVTPYGESLLDLLYPIETGGYTFTRTNGTVSFDVGALRVAGEFTEMLIGEGDFVLDLVTGLRFYISDITGTVITLTQMNAYTQTNGVVTTRIAGPTAGSRLYVYPARWYAPPVPIWGDLTSGSADITNVGNGAGDFPAAGMPVANDYLVSHGPYCKGTRNLFTTGDPQAVKVVTVTSGTKTITVNRNAAVTQARVPLNLWIRATT